MVKLQESDGKYTIIVPKSYVKRLRWKKGREVLPSLTADEKGLILR